MRRRRRNHRGSCGGGGKQVRTGEGDGHGYPESEVVARYHLR